MANTEQKLSHCDQVRKRSTSECIPVFVMDMRYNDELPVAMRNFSTAGGSTPASKLVFVAMLCAFLALMSDMPNAHCTMPMAV